MPSGFRDSQRGQRELNTECLPRDQQPLSLDPLPLLKGMAYTGSYLSPKSYRITLLPITIWPSSGTC
ncbi:hypothetical protein ACLOJK_004763 [Asimina triloba]